MDVIRGSDGCGAPDEGNDHHDGHDDDHGGGDNHPLGGDKFGDFHDKHLCSTHVLKDVKSRTYKK